MCAQCQCDKQKAIINICLMLIFVYKQCLKKKSHTFGLETMLCGCFFRMHCDTVDTHTHRRLNGALERVGIVLTLYVRTIYQQFHQSTICNTREHFNIVQSHCVRALIFLIL